MNGYLAIGHNNKVVFTLDCKIGVNKYLWTYP